MSYEIPHLPLGIELEDKRILKQLAISSRLLGEVKGAAEKIPNKGILISALTLMEAKDSSKVENIVTTNDELYNADLECKEFSMSAAAKEVLNYRQAINEGYKLVKKQGLITNRTLIAIFNILKGTDEGFRKGRVELQGSGKRVVYTPPENTIQIPDYMANLERFINDSSISDLDDLVKMAVIHHQFESIHPFSDGNGRTGRILCILYLVLKGLLDIPTLYLSRYITHNKSEYYRLLQEIRDVENNEQQWKNWIYYMLKGVEETAISTLSIIEGINQLMTKYKQILKPLFGKTYKHDLINNLFFHPYTKIEYIMRDMNVERLTAARYLNKIVAAGLLVKTKSGRSNYYINTHLVELFLNHQSNDENNAEAVESVDIK